MDAAENPQVFLSHTWVDEAAVDVVEQALTARGIPVIRDKRIHPGVPGALDSAALVVAFYSRRYPVQSVCQWELTRALLAGADRVLIVNPEPDNRHIVPALPAFSWRDDGPRLADAVAERLDGIDGSLGDPDTDSRGRPCRFVGRYRELLDLRHALRVHGKVLVTGAAGMGKTALAEQYAYLFADAYPGGRAWTSFAGVAPEAARAHWAAEVCRVGRAWFGLGLSGLDLDQAVATLAERITTPALWVLDDAPAHLRQGLDLRTAHIVFTGEPDSSITQVSVPGLTILEAEELFLTDRAEPDPCEQQAIADLVARSQGHPLAVVPALRALRAGRGIGVPGAFDMVKGLADVVRARGHAAQVVLAFAALLAPVPFTGEIIVSGVADLLGLRAPALVARALDELDEHGLLHRTDDGAHGQTWRLPTLVATAVRRHLDPGLSDALADHAAVVILRAGTVVRDDAHVLAIAGNPAVPQDRRLALRRRVGSARRARGDLPAAHAVFTAAGDWSPDDQLTAARLALTTGVLDDVLRRALPLIDHGDTHTACHARFLAATAYDARGDYPAANRLFHAHDHTPPWHPWAPHNQDSNPQRTIDHDPAHDQARLDHARALRRRGRYHAARDLITPLWTSSSPTSPLWPQVAVERARLDLAAGRLDTARRLADRVVAVLTDTGLHRHHLTREATAVLIEADLTVPWTDRRPNPHLHRAIITAEQATADSTAHHGPDHPLTSKTLVLQAIALNLDRHHTEAAHLLAAANARIAAKFAQNHPLALRAQHWTAQATAAQGDHRTAADLLEDLLPRQETVLGPDHPDTGLTRFTWGVSLIAIGERRGSRLTAAAERVLRHRHGPFPAERHGFR
ncbi:tetratricopeptide repeat protein [Actinokineospora enzanensis]|uniref:tetratricopeptide repeat protein n=1 Tax=Actinokineospora enzanensis TaxID=155975 RepID=UPI00035EB9A0|nr:TIR domain-containing protein [Actinokineospora enzanensis]